MFTKGCVSNPLPQGTVMPDAYYFRQQAHTCARLALATRDEGVAERFVRMAHEYLAKAAEAEQGSETAPPMVPEDGLCNGK